MHAGRRQIIFRPRAFVLVSAGGPKCTHPELSIKPASRPVALGMGSPTHADQLTAGARKQHGSERGGRDAQRLHAPHLEDGNHDKAQRDQHVEEPEEEVLERAERRDEEVVVHAQACGAVQSSTVQGIPHGCVHGTCVMLVTVIGVPPPPGPPGNKGCGPPCSAQHPLP